MKTIKMIYKIGLQNDEQHSVYSVSEFILSESKNSSTCSGIVNTLTVDTTNAVILIPTIIVVKIIYCIIYNI